MNANSCKQNLFLTRTVGADSLYHVVYGVRHESVGQCRLWDGNVMQAKSALANLAIEVCMMVVLCAVFMSSAYLVLEGAVAVLYPVDEVVLKQERECAEDGASFCRNHLFLQFFHGEWVP